MADIAPVVHVLPADFIDRCIGAPLRPGNVFTQRADTQYPSATGDNIAVLQTGTGVENPDIVTLDSIKAIDYQTFLIVTRVAAGGQHHAQAGARIPLSLHLVQTLIQRRLAQFQQI